MHLRHSWDGFCGAGRQKVKMKSGIVSRILSQGVSGHDGNLTVNFFFVWTSKLCKCTLPFEISISQLKISQHFIFTGFVRVRWKIFFFIYFCIWFILLLVVTLVMCAFILILIITFVYNNHLMWLTSNVSPCFRYSLFFQYSFVQGV